MIRELRENEGSQEQELMLKNEISRLHLLIHDKDRQI